jgi:ketosteroid isomerase-like protein
MKFRNTFAQSFWIAALVLAFLSTPATLSAQSQKKNKKQDAPADTTPASPQPPTPDQLDNMIGEMLGAWQIGQVETMHKYYAEDATFTSGAYEPPIIGWPNYLVAYQKQRARIQTLQLIRRNTNIFFRSDFAWATYQWEFDAVVDNRSMVAHGQTTLVFAKTGDKWLIVHNHTSQVCDISPSVPAAAPADSAAPPPKPQN